VRAGLFMSVAAAFRGMSAVRVPAGRGCGIRSASRSKRSNGASSMTPPAPGCVDFRFRPGPTQLAALITELETYTPACWHTSKTPAVRVLAGHLRLVG
jgi:hypothetical protein